MADEGQLECQVSGSVSSVRLWTLLVGDMAARQESLSANSKSSIRAMSATSEQDNSSSAEARWARLTAPDGSASSAGPGLRTFKALGTSTEKRSLGVGICPRDDLRSVRPGFLHEGTDTIRAGAKPGRKASRRGCHSRRKGRSCRRGRWIWISRWAFERSPEFRLEGEWRRMVRVAGSGDVSAVDWNDYYWANRCAPNSNNWPSGEVDSDWTISLENASTTAGNASSASYQLRRIRDGYNYYDRNFSVSIYTVKFDPDGGSGSVVSRKCNVLGTLPATLRTWGLISRLRWPSWGTTCRRTERQCIRSWPRDCRPG